MSGNDRPTRELPGHTRSTRLTALWSRRWRSRVLLVALVSAAAIGVGGYSLAVVQGRADRQEQRAEQEEGARQEATTAVEQLCAQVRQLGGRCVVEPEELTGEPIPPTEEQLRPLVQEFVDDWLTRNPPADGRDAPTLAELTAVIVAEIAAELERNPPPTGPPGQTPTPEQLRPLVTEVVAAHLLATPPPPGPAGQDGAPGADGAPGQDGQPPVSWTFTVQPPLGVGPSTTYLCERDDPFDPAAPRYTCQPTEPGPPPEEESGG